MIRAALAALARRDLQGAQSLVELDEYIDRASWRAFDHLLALGGEGDLLADVHGA